LKDVVTLDSLLMGYHYLIYTLCIVNINYEPEYSSP